MSKNKAFDDLITLITGIIAYTVFAGIVVFMGWLGWLTVSGIWHWVTARPKIIGIAGIKFGCKPPRLEDRGGFDGFGPPVTYETPIGNKVYRVVIKSYKDDYFDAKCLIQTITGIKPKETSIKQGGVETRSCIFDDPNSSRYIKVEYSRLLEGQTSESQFSGATLFGARLANRSMFEGKGLFGGEPKHIGTQIEAMDERLRLRADNEAFKEKLRRAR